MLGGGDEHAAAHQAGGIAYASHVAPARRNRGVIQIGAEKNDAGGGWRRKDSNRNRHSTVKPYAAGLDGALHGCFKSQLVLLRDRFATGQTVIVSARRSFQPHDMQRLVKPLAWLISHMITQIVAHSTRFRGTNQAGKADWRLCRKRRTAGSRSRPIAMSYAWRASSRALVLASSSARAAQ